MRLFHSTAIGLIVATTACSAAQARAADCQGLSGKSFGGALVVETNDIKPPFVATSMTAKTVTVATPFCRVRALLRPTPDSAIYFELWMPPAETWNGKYQGNAPGGYAGSMLYEPSARAVRAGYAASTTDNGHTGSNALEWAVGHPEKVADWGWRAVHETAVASKAIIAAYYGTGPRRSYFVGCSKGGGSALTEAQRFPDDYNGIVAAAPGWNHSGQLTKYLWTIQTVQAPGGWVSPAKLATLHKAVFAACGAKGEFIDNPRACTFDPARLLCKAGNADGCLTPPEVTSVRRIYSGPVDADGKSIYPGYALGSELNWSRAMMGERDKPGIGTTSFNSFTNMVRGLLLDNRDFDLQALVPSEIYRQARAKLGSSWDAIDPDLSAFRAAGGKMITYQGWSDDSVPAAGTTRYYDMVANKMGGTAKIQSFYRLFMAPGMDHCAGGVGPNAVGGAYGLDAPAQDPEHDVVAALDRWVDQGVAPDRIVATHYRENDPAKGADAQRPWCPYPTAPRHNGTGDRTLAASWTCPLRSTGK